MNVTLEQLKGRKPALIALGVGGTLLLLALASLVYGAMSAQADARADMRYRMAVYRAEVAQSPALASRLKDVRNRAQSEAGLLKESNAALAAAQIQSDMKAIAAANAGEIRSAQPLPATTANGFETVPMSYDLLLPLSHLRALAYAVETQTPYLFLDNVDIVAPQNGQSDADPQLELRVVVRGYRWTGSK
jgi:general secretion pathway protein M